MNFYASVFDTVRSVKDERVTFWNFFFLCLPLKDDGALDKPK